MREFRGDETLAFTQEEADAIHRAEAWGQPMVPQARARSWKRPIFCAVACTLIVWFMISRWHLFVAEPPERTRPPLTVAIVRKAVHVREQPSVQARSLGVLSPGTMVTVEEQRADGFDRVAGSGVRGYTAGAYLALSGEVELVPASATRIAGIEGNARLREQSGLAATGVVALPSGTPVTLLGVTRTGWSLVSTSTRTGFVWGGLLEDQPSLPFRPRQEGGERVVFMNGTVLRP